MWNEILDFIIFTSLVFIVYKLVMMALINVAEKRNIVADALNGIKFILRFIAVFLIVFSFFALLGVSSENLISISSISGMVIGFASSEVMSQVVSGFYIIITRPFGVRDLVKIDGTEGIVVEIGVTYTIIEQFDGTMVKIPNKKLLDSKITNYTITLSQELTKRQKDNPKLQKIEKLEIKEILKKGIKREELKGMFENLSDFMFEEEVTRYLFDIEVDLGLPPKEVFEKLEEVCIDYTKVFNYKPRFIVNGLGYRAIIRFRIYCTNPRTILNNQCGFLEDITSVLYGKQVM